MLGTILRDRYSQALARPVFFIFTKKVLQILIMSENDA